MSPAAVSSRSSAIGRALAIAFLAASATACPPSVIEREPPVPPPLAIASLSPKRMRMVSKGTPRSSAATCAKVVSWPWPLDWVPTQTSTPASLTSMRAASLPGNAQISI